MTVDNGLIKRYLVHLNEDIEDDWHEREVGEYHASATGKCVRRNYYDYLWDVQPEASAYVHFELGHRLEELYLESLIYEHGKRFVKTDVPIRIEFDDFVIVGETDPVVVNSNNEIRKITEVKTTADLRYTQDKPKRTHLYQTHCYMKALGQDTCVIVYINKKNLDSVTHHIEFDDDVWDDIVDRTERLHDALLHDEPPDPVTDEDEQDYFCPHDMNCCKNA